MHALPQKVIGFIRQRELLKAGDRIGLAVSGGSDSVALLRIFLELRSELGVVLSVVHFNHRLRGSDSDADQKLVAELARSHNLEFHLESADVAATASLKRQSLETAARELRYEFFRKLLRPDGEGARPDAHFDMIATGHTLDDQAETVLMRIIRGTGTRGLGGIYPVLELEDEFQEPVGTVIRPLLPVRRWELEEYLKSIGQSWREDLTNRDPKFTRNRVRHALLPLLEHEFNPSISEGLAEMAEIARGEEDFWENEISGWMGTAIHWSEPEWTRATGNQELVQIAPHNSALQRLREPGPLVMNAMVDLAWLLSEPQAVQRRAMKAVGDLAGFPLEFKHVEEILRFALDEENNGKSWSLPLGWKVLREAEALTFLTPDLRTQERIPGDYEYRLPLPGRAMVPEVGIVVEAMRVKCGTEDPRCNPDQLIDPSKVSKEWKVRNWRPGDRYWPVHTKEPKKVKELLQGKHITGADRKLWPVVASGDEIIWVRGFPAPTRTASRNNLEEGILIRDMSLED